MATGSSVHKVQIIERTFVRNTKTIPAGDDEENDDIQSRAVNKLSFIADPRYESLSVQIGGIVKVTFADGTTWTDEEALRTSNFDGGLQEEINNCHVPKAGEMQRKTS
jgi:hypothetical protein